MTGRVSGVLLALLVAGCSDEGPPQLDSHSSTKLILASDGVPGRYIVVFENTVAAPAAVAAQLTAAHGGTLRYTYQYALRGFAANLSDAAAAALARNPIVAFVEQDQVAMANELWGLDRIDQRSLPLDNSYQPSHTGAGATAYVIDTGILPSHLEFEGRASVGFTSIGDSGIDCNGHGTHVAGTIGGKTYGVARKVALIGVRVLDCNGSGTWSSVIAGVDWVTANHSALAVANMSLGGGGSTAVDLAVTNMIASGVSTAVAAGNDATGGSPWGNACSYSPARVASALTTGATNSTDTRASFSNWGDCVDLFAPGVSILSAYNRSDTSTATLSGTSMAAPHVAGVAALYLDANPSATAADVINGVLALTSKGVVLDARSARDDLVYGQIGTAPAACGDGSCAAGETCSSCEADCGACTFCGDGSCNGGETCSSCEADCGACTCLPLGESCTSAADCCSGKCRGPRTALVCK